MVLLLILVLVLIAAGAGGWIADSRDPDYTLRYPWRPRKAGTTGVIGAIKRPR